MDVFSDPLSSDERLLQRLIASTKPSVAAKKKPTLSIRCEMAAPARGKAFRVPCLGSLSQPVLLGAALAEVQEICLIKGECSECRLKEAEPMIEEIVRSTRAVLENLGLSEIPIRLQTGGPPGRNRITRRDLFPRLGGTGRAAGGDPGRGAPKDRRSESGRRFPQVREGQATSGKGWLLRSLLEDAAVDPERTLRYDSRLSWAKVEIDEDLCTACGACVDLCPTGALRRVEGDEHHVLYFKGSDCTNCALCVEACAPQAIDFADRFTLAEAFDETWRRTARIEVLFCQACGETIPAREGEICSTCARRHVSPSRTGRNRHDLRQ